jgi:uncharacterized protein
MKQVNQVRDSTSDLPFGSWQRVRGDLPDVNIWLALSQADHSHHAAAKAYWQEAMLQLRQEETRESPAGQVRKLYFCRTTMLGLVRVLCQSGRAKGQQVEMHQAMAAYQRFMDIEEVAFLQEPWLGVDATLTMLLNVHPKLPLRLSTDVYLAALAQTTGLRLVSFDRDYLRFEGLDCLILDGKPSAL